MGARYSSDTGTRRPVNLSEAVSEVVTLFGKDATRTAQARTGSFEPSFEPGQGWEYSSSNFLLLGMALVGGLVYAYLQGAFTG